MHPSLSGLQPLRSDGIPGEPGIPTDHRRRRPNRRAGDDAEQHQPGADGDALEEVLLGATAGRGGAVKTWPTAPVAAARGRLTPSGAATGRAADRAGDVAEELAGHPLGHRAEHPLADAADHAADDRVGVVRDARAVVGRRSRRRR